jgi:hypothetical protein
MNVYFLPIKSPNLPKKGKWSYYKPTANVANVAMKAAVGLSAGKI